MHLKRRTKSGPFDQIKTKSSWPRSQPIFFKKLEKNIADILAIFFLKKSVVISACLPLSKFRRNIGNFRYFVDISAIFQKFP